MSFTPAFTDQRAVETEVSCIFFLALCWAIPTESPEQREAQSTQAHSDGWFALMTTSSLNALLLSLLSALTTCSKLLNELCLEQKAPQRLQVY